MKDNIIVRTLGSMKLTLIILGVFAVAIAVATFIEVRYGSDGARVLVYNARWFEVLLLALIVNLTVALLIKMPYQLWKIGYVLTHIGFIVVLIAAAITRYWGYEGTMPIREGHATNYMFSARDHIALEVDGVTNSFPVRLYKPGDMSLNHKLAVGDARYQVALSQYWLHYQEQVVDGAGGKPVVVLSRAEAPPVRLWSGDHFDQQGVKVSFLQDEAPPATHGTSFGELVIQADGEERLVPVSFAGNKTVSFQDHRYRITEVAPSFRVGSTPGADDPMTNPAIRVEVETPDGETHERLLFAFHPEFDMAHGGGEGDHLHGIDLKYRYTRNLYIQRDGDDIVAVADFELEIGSDHGQGEVTPVASGTRFPLAAGTTIVSGSFVIGAKSVHVSGVEATGKSDDTQQPPAVVLTVADEAGNRSEPTVVGWSHDTVVQLAGRDVRVSYAPIRIDLPYRLHLDDFVLLSYPGSENPASYESHVRLYDEARGVDGRPVRIYMNHPLTYRGFKFFQSSYDRDRRGTILSVNRDPGKIPTYIGYTIIGIGFLITLTRGMWYRKRGNANARPKMKSKTKKRVAAVAAGCILAFTITSSAAWAQETGHEGHDHSAPGHTHDPTMNFLSPAARDAVRGLMVQDYQGRMKPLDTLARESVMKLSKRHHMLGWEPVDMYLSWMAHPSYWFEQPILRVRHPDLRSYLNLGEGVKHVTPGSLLDQSGNYLLAEEVDKTHRTPGKDRSKMQRKLLSLDERANVFNMAVRGLTLRLFPLPGDENNRWLAPGEFNEAVLAEMAPEVAEQYQTAFTDLYRGLQTLDNSMVVKGAQSIAAIQWQYGAAVMPSPRARAAELKLNALQPFTWVSLPYLAAFFILMAAYAWGLARKHGQPFKLTQPLYLLGIVVYFGSLLYQIFGYVLRWVASGHAPLTNGYESLIFISVAIAAAGGYYELRSRRGSIGGLAALLTSVILGVAMLPTFDAAISPLVPVLSSFWLIIHVTIITASYGFLGLAAVIAMTMLVLYLFKAPGRMTVRYAIFDLSVLHWNVLVAGIAFLSVGTFLGGVWANESWGRYWGWDPKETWSLVTILVYAFVIHMRFVDRLNTPLNLAAGSFLGISSVGMTYFGVNYFLSGLHSYAQGDSPGVPTWVYVMAVVMVLLVLSAYAVDGSRGWMERQETKGREKAHA